MGSSLDIQLGIERVVLISLPQREDRRQAFWEAFPPDWPLPEPQLVEAYDGRALTPPPAWRGGLPAYGCAMSHIHALQEAITDDVQSLMVLEDDAVFVPHFTEGLERVADEVPYDWRVLLLGGQHRRKPQRVTPTLVRCTQASRTHAYVVRKDAIAGLLRTWTRARSIIDQSWWAFQHVVPTYAPWPFLVGQAAGRSDITGLAEAERFWD